MNTLEINHGNSLVKITGDKNCKQLIRRYFDRFLLLKTLLINFLFAKIINLLINIKF